MTVLEQPQTLKKKEFEAYIEYITKDYGWVIFQWEAPESARNLLGRRPRLFERR